MFILVGEDVVVVNPNATYRASLPSSAAAEYELALSGAPLLAPEPGEDASVAVTDGAGCYEQGWASLGEDPSTEYLSLIEEVNAASRATLEHPEYLAAMAHWSACMSDAGYPGMTKESDPAFYLQDLMNAKFPLGAVLPEDPRLSELIELERELASIHLACLDSSHAYAVRSRLVDAAEREVMERRAEELAAYVAALRERAGL